MDQSETDSIDTYNSILGFHVVSATPSRIQGWVDNEDVLQEVIETHSIDTLSQFVSWHDDKTRQNGSSTNRLLWNHKDVPMGEEQIPFSVDRHIIRQCSFGKAHKREKKNTKVPDQHTYSQKKTYLQPTRKTGCAAQVIIRYVTIHPDYDGKDLNSRQRQAIMEDLRTHLSTNDSYTGLLRIYISLPLRTAHTQHEITDLSVFNKRLHPNIINKIHEIVLSGISNIPTIKKALRQFVESEFSQSDVKPSMFDRSYYPLSKDIKNHVYSEEEFHCPQCKNKTITDNSTEDDAVEDEDDEDIGTSVDTEKFEGLHIIPYIRSIMVCEEDACNILDHERHHEFLKNPLFVYNRERRTHGFGNGQIARKTTQELEQYLCNELVFSYQDKKKPYTGKRGRRIRGLSEGKLFNIFVQHGLLADSYILSVLLKEALVFLICKSTDVLYEYANEKCKEEEVNMDSMLKKK